MQKARRHPTCGLRPLVGVRFQVLFHPSIRSAFHLSFTVLVHYRSRILFSLRSWSTWIHTGFHVSDATYECIVPNIHIISNTGLLPSLVGLSIPFFCNCKWVSLFELCGDTSCNPYTATGSSLAPYRFGLFQFRSSLLSESRLISFPSLLRYFNSAGFLLI